MGFIGYLILGSVVYAVGFFIHKKWLTPKRELGVKYTLLHPLIVKLLLACLVVMMLVSVLLGRFVLGHDGIDVAFVGVNSLVATFVFYFGLNPDQTQMNIPD